MVARLLGACGFLVLFAGLAAPALAFSPAPVPEIDAGSAASALTVLSGGLLVLSSRLRRT